MNQRSRVKDYRVGDIFFIESNSSSVTVNLNTRRTEQWMKVTMRDDQAGEYIVETVQGERISLDGYEQARVRV
jgi:hypothetical protein